MPNRTVETVMTRDVVSVLPDTTFKEIATLLSDNDISAVPVTDFQGRVIGVVSEADLLRRYEPPPARHRWQRRVAPFPRMRRERYLATELMTTPAHTVGTGTSIVMAARLLTNRGIRRAPVVDADGALVGIVSRHDLVRVFVRPDEDIADEIHDDVLLRELVIDPAGVDVDVREGVVTLRGQVERASLVPIAGKLVDRVDGVVDVVNQLTFATEDSHVDSGLVSQNVGVLHRLGGQH